MAKPTDAEVEDDVKQIIGAFARVDPGEIDDADELVATLRLRDVDVPFLAMSLRGYVKRFEQASTVTTSEVRKAKTAGATVKLVQGKIK